MKRDIANLDEKITKYNAICVKINKKNKYLIIANFLNNSLFLFKIKRHNKEQKKVVELK